LGGRGRGIELPSHDADNLTKIAQSVSGTRDFNPEITTLILPEMG
jgi:hypothetical protein